MALELQISRLTKLLVDSESITFDEAQARLRGLTLEVHVGNGAASRAAHAAILTAVLVGSRAFIGGVRITGQIDQPLISAQPIDEKSLGAAAVEVGATGFEGKPVCRLIVGQSNLPANSIDIHTWWDGWQAGAALKAVTCGPSENPLAGNAAGALGVCAAFEIARGLPPKDKTIDLWPTYSDAPVPKFEEVSLPGALWLVGLGNLGQAFLWSLASLPFADPKQVSIVLQDRDHISEENWATSILVRQEVYGALKTKVAEAWAEACGFMVRRVDRRLQASDRLENDDPKLALCGVDKVKARAAMGSVGFECIVDAGLGRSAAEFDRYRVTVFDADRPVEKHFQDQNDAIPIVQVPDSDSYRKLECEVGNCGAIEIAGASVAAAFVSAVAAAIAVARTIAIVSGCAHPANEVDQLTSNRVRRGPINDSLYRATQHAGRPKLGLAE